MKIMEYRNFYFKIITKCFTLFLFCIFLIGCQNSKKNIDSADKITIDSIKQLTPLQKNDDIILKEDTLIKISKPFFVNGIKCYWEFTLEIFEDSPSGEGTIKLKSSKNNKILLSYSDIYYLEEFNKPDMNDYDFYGNRFVDVNFDGLKDFALYSRLSSGSGVTHTEVYVFDKPSKRFLPSELSGGEFEVNEKNKTVSTFQENGYRDYTTFVSHFDKKGSINCREYITREEIEVNKKTLLKRTYQKMINGRMVNGKIINGKIIKRTVDTVEFNGW